VVEIRERVTKTTIIINIMNATIMNNRLIVAEAINDDNSTVHLASSTMEAVGIFRGDNVVLKGKQQRESVAIVLPAEVPEGYIHMNKVLRTNLRVCLGEYVTIQECRDMKFGVRVHILPVEGNVEGLTEDILKVYLMDYFSLSYRPIHRGDLVVCPGIMGAVEFKIVACDPEPCCILAPNTAIFTKGEPVKREDE
jgi:transitional endoplasmic reticulum ATPase